ncbi:hypothetical protein INT43_004065 [Umbelopsis isabellina]|uniref:Uncharacterized protein n=1 Tax=Mortierella isabellina TaxID=91625 RepID=A0A8H7UC86_MORIS|nr:hypothetical protein INT43_004065 [Umbelopsis isabellina]
MYLTDEQQYSIWKIATTFRVVSVLTGLAVLISYMLMVKFEPCIADRISLRLVFAANICVVFLTAWQFVIMALPITKPKACIATEFFLLFSDTTASILLMFVGINLMLVIVFSIPTSRRIEWGYYIITFVIGLAIALGITALSSTRIHDSFDRSCWYMVYYTNNNELRFTWIIRYMVSFAIVAISMVAFAITLNTLFTRKTWLNGGFDSNRNNQAVHPQKLYKSYRGHANSHAITYRKVALRCMMYSGAKLSYANSVLIFTKIWGLIYVLVALTTGEQNYPLLVIDQCASGTTGLLIGIVFFSDPAVISSASECREYLRCRYVDEYSEIMVTHLENGFQTKRRLSSRIVVVKTRRSTQLSQDTVLLDKTVAYKHPKWAKLVNSILTRVFKFKARPRRCRDPDNLEIITEYSMFKNQSDMYKEVEVPVYHYSPQSFPKEDEEIIAVPQPALAGKGGPSHNVQRRNTIDNHSVSFIDNDDIMPHFPKHILEGIHSDPDTHSDQED